MPEQPFLIESLEKRQLLSGAVSLVDAAIGSATPTPHFAASANALQSGWTDGDIGSPGLAGSATYDMPSDTWTLTGSGADIYGTSDQFHFTSRPMSGDGSAIAYVNSITNTDPWAKAGVMIRASSAADAAFAGLFVSPSNGVVFEWRPNTAAAVQQEVSSPPGGPTHAPVSLKLTRSGNSFAAYYSTDGINWILVGPSQTASIPTSALAGLAVTSHSNSALCTASFSSVGLGATPPPGAGVFSSADQLFLDDLEKREFLYFFNETNPNTGLTPDSSNANGGGASAFSSIAALGFGLTALTIGDQRGWVTDAAAYQRALTTINFLYTTASQVNGFFFHFLNPVTGQRYGTSEVSSVDTAELMAGVLNVAQYWSSTPLAGAAMALFNRVNWPWMQQPIGVFYGAWTPEGGFSGGYGDFSEAALLYLIGLGSPTHPTARSSWTSWSRTPVRSYAGMTYVTADDAALFTVQYPMAWFDLRGLVDDKGLNYYSNAQTATLSQRQWMGDLHTTYSAWSLNLWGLTPSDSAHGYAVWGGPPASGPIDGTVVPTGPGGSLAFTPRQSIDALKNMQQTYGSRVYKTYGLVDSFNPQNTWTSSLVLGIDIGMTLVAAENARSGFVWNTFNQNPVARQAMASAFPDIKPQLLGAVSRKTRPDSSVDDVPINVSGDSSAPESIEARTGGPTQIVLTFEANIFKGPNFSITLSSGTVTSSTVSGADLIINLSGVADAQTLTMNVTDVRHFVNTVSGNYTFSLGVLLADANSDATVDTLDFNALAGNFGGSGKTVSQGDFNDDGVVDTLDFNALAANFGKSIPSSSSSSSSSSSVMTSTAKSQAAGSTPLFSSIAVQDENNRLITDLLSSDYAIA